LIQGLRDLEKIGLKNKTELNSIGFDFSLLDKARAKSFELPEILAKLNNVLNDTNPHLGFRNSANAHLNKAVTEIRRIGKFVFWKDDNRRSGYVSAFLRQKNAERKKKPIIPLEKDTKSINE
jgi:hypothetical protein